MKGKESRIRLAIKKKRKRCVALVRLTVLL